MCVILLCVCCSLYFGEAIPGQVYPLDGRLAVPGVDTGTGVYQYFIKIVPTRFNTGSFLSSHTLQAAQVRVLACCCLWLLRSPAVAFCCLAACISSIPRLPCALPCSTL